MNQTITINKKDIRVSFSDYYDSELGEFLFIQVMCDVYMPGNEVVPIEVEKQQIKSILEGFKKRKALYDELNKEEIKGKSLYLITPKMRYDLDWMKEKPKLLSSKDPRAMLAPSKVTVEESEASDHATAKSEPVYEQKQPVFTDNRRSFLQSKGFKLNLETNNWEIKDIRFPDSKIDKSKSDEEFESGMTSLLNASYQNHLKRKSKAPKKD